MSDHFQAQKVMFNSSVVVWYNNIGPLCICVFDMRVDREKIVLFSRTACTCTTRHNFLFLSIVQVYVTVHPTKYVCVCVCVHVWYLYFTTSQ